MCVLPHFFAPQNINTRLTTMHSDPQTKKPGERNRCLNPSMVVTLCCSGAFRARIVAPIIQRTQPIQPWTSAWTPIRANEEREERTNSVRDSFKKKCDKMAEMTTDKAPMGVTRIASVKALPGQLPVSPPLVVRVRLTRQQNSRPLQRSS